MTSEVSAVSVGISFTPSLARPVRRFKSQRQHPPHHPCGSKHTHTHTHKQKLPETEAERVKEKKQRWWPSCFMAVAQSQEQSRDLLIFQKVSCLSSLFFFPQTFSFFFLIVTHWYVTLLLKWNATLPGVVISLFVGNPVVSPVQLTSLVFSSESFCRSPEPETLMARGAGVQRGRQSLFCFRPLGFYVHLQALDSYRWRAAYQSVQLFLCFPAI